MTIECSRNKEKIPFLIKTDIGLFHPKGKAKTKIPLTHLFLIFFQFVKPSTFLFSLALPLLKSTKPFLLSPLLIRKNFHPTFLGILGSCSPPLERGEGVPTMNASS